MKSSPVQLLLGLTKNGRFSAEEEDERGEEEITQRTQKPLAQYLP